MSRTPHVAREHELEPQFGLPEVLPASETMLWQGSPQWQRLARSVFHADKVAVYFGVLLAWRVASVVHDGGSLADAARSVMWLAPILALGLGLLLLLAWLTARTTVYTLTDKRVVMRIGIVLTVAFNLPLKRIEAAQLRPLGQGLGDIALTLERETRIAWLQLWPHVRPWNVRQPQPMLRSLPDAERVSALLAQAWTQVNGASGPVAASEPTRAAPGRAMPNNAGLAT